MSVSGKRKYASEAEALATASHQLATANTPKELRAYLCSGVTPASHEKGRKRREGSEIID